MTLWQGLRAPDQTHSFVKFTDGRRTETPALTLALCPRRRRRTRGDYARSGHDYSRASGVVSLVVSALALLSGPFVQAATQPGQSSNAEGQALAAELRLARPREDLEVKGSFKIRDPDGRRMRIPVRYRYVDGEKSWQTIYETEAHGQLPAEKLVVIHAEGEPNRYLYYRAGETKAAPGEGVTLEGDQAMISFGSSDFWMTDLGLECLHWPEQRIVEEAKIKMRKGRPCKVLESIDPRPGAAGYTRVRSWIDVEKRQPILAEAYGPDNKLIKEFEIGSVTKVNGQWELKNLEMRNAKTDSRTILEFKYEQKAGQ